MILVVTRQASQEGMAANPSTLAFATDLRYAQSMSYKAIHDIKVREPLILQMSVAHASDRQCMIQLGGSRVRSIEVEDERLYALPADGAERVMGLFDS